MDARTLARGQALGRLFFGAGLAFAPGRFAGGWVGAPADKPGGRVLSAAVGARDVALALGTLGAMRAGHGTGPWVRAGILCDAADLVATRKAGDDLPSAAVTAVTAIAAGSVALGVWLQRAVD